jgi:hypothetical protein
MNYVDCSLKLAEILVDLMSFRFVAIHLKRTFSLLCRDCRCIMLKSEETGQRNCMKCCGHY